MMDLRSRDFNGPADPSGPVQEETLITRSQMPCRV